MKNDDLRFLNSTHRSHYKFMNAKNDFRFFGEQRKGDEKLQQISILLICLSCLRTSLRGDYEFLSTTSVLEECRER